MKLMILLKRFIKKIFKISDTKAKMTDSLDKNEIEVLRNKFQPNLQKLEQKSIDIASKTNIRSLKQKQINDLKINVLNKRLLYLNEKKVLLGTLFSIKINKDDLTYLDFEYDKVSLRIKKQQEKFNNSLSKTTKTLDYLSSLENIKQNTMKRIVSLNDKKQKINLSLMYLNNDLVLLNNNKLPRKTVFDRFKFWFSNIRYDTQKAIFGILFVLPFVLGLSLIFLPSAMKTIYWSFFDVVPTPRGFEKTYLGFNNYIELFRDYVIYGNVIFSVEITSFMQRMALDIPIIIIFSILIAVLLNKKFKGHLLIKAIFFIPIVFNATLVSEMLNSSFSQMISNESQLDQSVVDSVIAFFMNLNIGEGIINIVLQTISRILEVINLSGIQILIFIAAIQSIPTPLYEAAKIEGATKYEIFWKITIPMITPLILTAVVFTVVDGFSRAPITQFLTKTLADSRYGLAASISVVYLLINVLIIAIVYLIVGRRVFYYDKNK